MHYFENMKIISFTTKVLFALFISISATGQNQTGYWDSPHAETKEIILGADERTWERIELPTGTTEVAIRITLLNKSQELTNKLASTLTSIPDPVLLATGTSVNLLSNIAGDDKCQFYIFKDAVSANKYINTGLIENSIYNHAQLRIS